MEVYIKSNSLLVILAVSAVYLPLPLYVAAGRTGLELN